MSAVRQEQIEAAAVPFALARTRAAKVEDSQPRPSRGGRCTQRVELRREHPRGERPNVTLALPAWRSIPAGRQR
jgi:hypothetical protein